MRSSTSPCSACSSRPRRRSISSFMRPWYMLWYICRWRRYWRWYSPSVILRSATWATVRPSPCSSSPWKAGMYRMMNAMITSQRKPNSHRR